MNVLPISFLWKIPLSFLSFLFFKAMKLIIGNLFIVYLAFNKEKSSQWRVLSAETLQTTLSLPVLMTKGPRWNTHAIIGTLGPLTVKKSIALNIEEMQNSAKSWVGAIYTFPGYRTIASIDPGNHDLNKNWYSLKLPPGKYTIGLRYYNASDKVVFPVVKVDDIERVESKIVAREVNNFYYDLIKRQNWFYLSLHYYIFTILRLKKWLSASFVKNEYLPVGAPNTQFFYGDLKQGQYLQIEIESEILNKYDLYLTLYNRASFPVTWCEIKKPKQKTATVANNGFYLIRVRPKSSLSREISSKLSLDCQENEQDNLSKEIRIIINS